MTSTARYRARLFATVQVWAVVMASAIANEQSASLPMPAASSADRSLAREADAAIDRGLDWLALQQQPCGGWSNTNFPALTGLALWAFAVCDSAPREEMVRRAVDFIMSCVQPDGGIYRTIKGHRGGGLSNYNTAICAIALHTLGGSNCVRAVLNARSFLAAAQHVGEDEYQGGMGYDAANERAYADLNNSIFAFEAMRLTEAAEAHRPAGETRADLDWDAALRFLVRCQNTADSGADDVGGFFYRPGESKAGTTTNAAGAVVFRSQGSMTYAGLLGMRYAKVPASDERVRNAFKWADWHWTLDENPGVGRQGLYSYYNLMARAMAVYGRGAIPLSDSVTIDGRAELISRLVALQKIEPSIGTGFWVNPEGRFWENDPVLATSYALIALGVLKNMPAKP